MRRDQSGFTLIETMMSMVLLVIVFGATLTTFNRFLDRNVEANARTDAADRARQQIDQMARELRNLASPSTQAPNAVERTGPYDIIFQSVDPNGPNTGTNGPNIRRVRYCLDRTDPNRGVLRAYSQTWASATPPAAPSTTECGAGAAGWSNPRVLATAVVNAQNGQTRPVFGFDSATVNVRRLNVTLWIDPDPLKGVPATNLSTGIFLRNQNRPPTAAFTVERAGGRRIVLNATTSTDPEGEPLEYLWLDNGVKIPTLQGPTGTYDVPTDGTNTRAIQLKVYDPAKLEGAAPAQEVFVP